MNNYLSKIVALALFAMALTGAALAQSDAHELRANIPFSFYAGGQKLPAGEYTIFVNMLSHSAIVGQKAAGSRSMLMGSPDDRSRDERTVLIFKVAEGGVYVLREIKGPDLGVAFNAKAPRSAMRVQNQSNDSLAVIAEAR